MEGTVKALVRDCKEVRSKQPAGGVGVERFLLAYIFEATIGLTGFQNAYYCCGQLLKVDV